MFLAKCPGTKKCLIARYEFGREDILMKIAMLGLGHVGSRLAELWTRAGHVVVAGVRQGHHSEIAISGVRVMSLRDAVEEAEVVTLAVPWKAVQSVLQEVGSLQGKTLIDVTNPLNKDLGLLKFEAGSGGEQVAQWAVGARVVKAFNTIGAPLYGAAIFNAVLADGYLCGDDVAAKEIVRGLVADAGLDPLDVGSLRNAAYLEAIGALWIDLRVYGRLRGDFGFKLLKRVEVKR